MNKIRDPQAATAVTERQAALASAREIVLRLRGRPGAVYARVLSRSDIGELRVLPWGCRVAYWVGPAEVTHASVAVGLTPKQVAQVERRQRAAEAAAEKDFA